MKNNDTSAERKEPMLTFDHTFKVEVYEPDFEPLSSTNSLDEKKLSTGNHTIEFGYMKGGCCRKLVYAIIKDGMVVGIKAEECEDSKEVVSKEITALFSIVAKKLELSNYREPMSVEKFLAMAKIGSFGPQGIQVQQCYWICIWRWCVFCCDVTMTSDTPKCWIEARDPDPIVVIGGNP